MRTVSCVMHLQAVLLAILFTPSAFADTLQLLRPIEDALVVSDPLRVDDNFGEDPQLVVWANYPVFGARSYVKFDLSTVPAGEVVTFARLNFFQFLGGGFASGVDVFREADDSWQEATITWNHQPVLIPEAQDLISQAVALTGYERGWVSFDLLANGAWDPSLDLEAGDGKLSLIVRITGGEVNTQRVHNLCSSEGGAFDCLISGEAGPVAGRAPQLVIATPEPGVIPSLGASLVVVGLAARSRRSAPSRRSRAGV